ncbi:MAG TPA: hypothetical protein VFD90_04670 [Gaiellales bacterium]|nr:hypothetical protein [Gaiellales bacterium]
MARLSHLRDRGAPGLGQMHPGIGRGRRRGQQPSLGKPPERRTEHLALAPEARGEAKLSPMPWSATVCHSGFSCRKPGGDETQDGEPGRDQEDGAKRLGVGAAIGVAHRVRERGRGGRGAKSSAAGGLRLSLSRLTETVTSLSSAVLTTTASLGQSDQAG